MDQNPPESEGSRNGLPIISQETRDRMLEEMGVGGGNISQPDSLTHPTDKLMREAIDLQTRPQVIREKTERIENCALSSIDDIADVKPELLTVLKDAVESGLGTQDAIFTQDYALGMGLIIRVFHVQSDFRLISDLNKLTGEDLSRIGDVILTAIKNFGGLSSSRDSDPFTKALNRPRIPAHQQFLREIVEAPPQINSTMFSKDYKVGAGVMYPAMEIIWSRLYPGQISPEPPSAPPATGQTGPQLPPSSQ